MSEVIFVPKFYKWIKGDHSGRVEKTIDAIDATFTQFESGRKITTTLLSSYLMEVGEHEPETPLYPDGTIPELPIAIKTEYGPPPIIVNAQAVVISDSTYTKVGQLLEMADSSEKELLTVSVEIPRGKIALMLEIMGIDIKSFVRKAAIEKVDELLNNTFSE
jgi:hypothetical protein